MDLSKYGINTNALNTGTGQSPSVTIPGLDNLQSMFGIISIASIIIGAIFLVLYIVNIVQRMRADRAMITMQKDIAAIKVVLEQQITPVKTTSDPATTAPLPADHKLR